MAYYSAFDWHVRYQFTKAITTNHTFAAFKDITGSLPTQNFERGKRNIVLLNFKAASNVSFVEKEILACIAKSKSRRNAHKKVNSICMTYSWCLQIIPDRSLMRFHFRYDRQLSMAVGSEAAHWFWNRANKIHFAAAAVLFQSLSNCSSFCLNPLLSQHLSF